MSAAAPERSCPRTGRSRAPEVGTGELRPSDSLTLFLVAGVAWLLAGAGCAVAYALGAGPDLLWLALHFAFVGGVSQLVVGAAQFFACAFLATNPPRRGPVLAELAAWNLATALIAVGVPAGVVALTGTGGLLVLVGLAIFSWQLIEMRRRSIQAFPWATRWYQTAALFLALGTLLGPAMADGVPWARGSLLGAHLALNIGGWFGTAIVGTLHTFYPSLTATRLRFARLQLPAWALWATGIALVALGSAFSQDAFAIAGWLALAGATAMLLVNVAASAAGGSLGSAPTWLLTAGQALLAAGILGALVATVEDGPTAALVEAGRERVLLAILAGWIGLTVMGSLLQLLGLMARVRGGVGRPAKKQSPDLWAAAGLAAVVAGLLLLLGSDGSGEAPRILLAAGYALLLARVAWLGRRAASAAPFGLRRRA